MVFALYGLLGSGASRVELELLVNGGLMAGGLIAGGLMAGELIAGEPRPDGRRCGRFIIDPPGCVKAGCASDGAPDVADGRSCDGFDPPGCVGTACTFDEGPNITDGRPNCIGGAAAPKARRVPGSTTTSRNPKL